jgi:hypothetical protein
VRDVGSWRALLRHPDVRGAALATLLGGVTAFLSLRLWQWQPGAAPSVTGDSPLVLTQIDDVLRNGWFWSNDAIGFPLGQNASFFPELNVVHVLGVKALGVFSGDAATVGSIYFVLGWPLIALTTYLLFRSERLTRTAAVVGGVLFANAPYHVERFEHLWLGSYWTVPVALWLVLAVARGRTPADPNGEGRPWRQAAWALAMVLVGLSGAYYAGFTLLLLVAVLVLRAGRGRPSGWWRGGLATAAGVGVVAALPLVAARVGMAGTMLTGPRPATRSPIEAERYAGRIVDLLLPWEGHRLEPLATLTQTYQAAGRPVVETVALGLVGAAGAVALVLVGLRALTTGRDVPARLRLWAGLVVVTGAFFTVGGLGSVVALFATPQLRTWSRLSIVILLLALLAVGHWLSRPRSRAGAALLAGATLLVGFLDQTNPDRAPDWAANARVLDTIGAYTGDLSDATPGACGVLQLPVMRFPEGRVPQGYEINQQLLQHLTTTALAWSHGGMSGTAAGDWPLGMDLSQPDRLHRELRAAGFCALEVDTRAVPLDNPTVLSLTRPLGAPVAQTPDGRLVAWSLDAAPGGDAVDRDRLLEPVLVGLTSGWTIGDSSGAQDTGPRTYLFTSNLSETTVPGVAISVDVASLGAAERELVVRDGTTELGRWTIREGETTPVRLTVDAPPGNQRLTVEISGPPVRDDAEQSVSARFENLTTSGPGPVRVASLQEQAATGVVFP